MTADRVIPLPIDTSRAGGIALVAATIVALAWTNLVSPQSYQDFFQYELRFPLGGSHSALTVRECVNEGLMTLFFLAVGLEVKGAIFEGSLAQTGRALVSVVAAAGGVLVPIAVFFIVGSLGGAPLAAWPIPMVTDTAFALGLIAILGERVRPELRIFFVAIVVVDDVAAILALALFFSQNLSIGDLFLSLITVAVAGWYGHRGHKSLWALGPLFLLAWLFTLRSGVHGTLAGVLFAFVLPPGAHLKATGKMEQGDSAEDALEWQGSHRYADSMSQKVERAIHPWVVLGVAPLFALANAGVPLASLQVNALTLAIFLGLLAGKPLGMFLSIWIAKRCKTTGVPGHSTDMELFGLTIFGGVGLTMSLLFATLTLSGTQLEQGKAAVLLASAIAGMAGLALLGSRRNRDRS